jgi:uncharacterized protein (DUF1330 family)
MPAAYVLGSYDILDPKGYEGYVPGVLPLLEKHGAEVLVAEFDASPLEGAIPASSSNMTRARRDSGPLGG